MIGKIANIQSTLNISRKVNFDSWQDEFSKKISLNSLPQVICRTLVVSGTAEDTEAFSETVLQNHAGTVDNYVYQTCIRASRATLLHVIVRS